MALGRGSSLEAAGTLVATAPSPGSILHHCGVGHWSGVVDIRPNYNYVEFCAWLVLNYSSYVVLG